jgi:probable phosphoglycerate mutase
MARRLIYVARHGETDWNVAGRWQGHTDIPLNQRGHAQARALGHALRSVRLAGAVSSDLCRARDTARIAAEVAGVRLHYVDPDLRERTLGCFEGLTREECERLHPVAWKAWLEQQQPPDGGEHTHQLALRVKAAIRRVAERVASEAEAALVVTHGGALRAVLTEVVGHLSAPVANGGVWRLVWEERIVAAEQVEPATVG